MLRRSITRLCSTANSSGGDVVLRRTRAVAWFRPRALDINTISRTLAQRGIPSHCAFPPLPSAPRGVSAGAAWSKPGGAATTAPGASGKVRGSSIHSHPHTRTEFDMICFSLPRATSSMVQSEEERAASKNPAATPDEVTYVVFSEGSIVGWDATWDDMTHTRRILEACCEGTAEQQSKSYCHTPPPLTLDMEPSGSISDVTVAESSVVVDTIEYKTFDQLSPAVIEELGFRQSYVDTERDRFVLSTADPREKVPFSCALAMSVKLDAMNAAMNPISNSVRQWQQRLAADGSLQPNVRQLRKAKTHVLSLVEHFNFHSASTTPKIFWSGEYHAMRSVFRDASEHFEVEERGEALRTKMEAANESLTYLHDEVHASSNELLTWVIIWLIALEVTLALGVFHSIGEGIYAAVYPSTDDNAKREKKSEASSS